MAQFSDNFNRANGALGANYTRGSGPSDGLTIVNNAVLVSDAGQNARWIRTAEAIGNDQIAGVDIVSGLGVGSGYAQIGARGSGVDATFQGYEVFTDGASGNSHTEIQRINAGVPTTLKGVNTTFSHGDKLGIRVTGSNPVLIELLKDTGSGWVVVDSVNDASTSRIASGGGVFLSGWSNTAASQPVLDNFTGGDVALGAELAAAAANVASASAVLSTEVRLGANASSSVSSSAALTTAIELAAAALSEASATGVFATGALLAAAATNVAITTAALSTSIQAQGEAKGVVSASGALTNWASVTLSGALYTGQGGVLDPNFWVETAPTLGTTLYYDPTHITIYPNGEISSDVPNCSAIVQFFDGAEWHIGLIVFTELLAAVGRSQASASAQMTTAIHLAAAASALATATAAFSTGAGLNADAAGEASATADLSTEIPLSALASSVTDAVGALTTEILLVASAVAESESHAVLDGVIAMQAAASAISAATADLTTSITPAADAKAQASGAASMTTAIHASAQAQSIASSAAALRTAITLVAQAASSSSSSADLTTSRPLVAAALNIVTAIATLSTGIDLSANAESIAKAAADLDAAINLFADAVSQATATAELTNIIDSPPVDAYPIDPRFVISRSMVDESIGRRTPRFMTKDPLDRCVLCFDFADQLCEGETLKGRITRSIGAIAGTDPESTGILVGVPSYDSTMTKILQPIFGGVDACKYYVKMSAGTTNELKSVSLAGLLSVAS